VTLRAGLALAAVLALAAGEVHVRQLESGWPERSAAWTGTRVRRLHERRDELVRAVSRAAEAVAREPEAAAAAAGNAAARSRLFSSLATHVGSAPETFPEPLTLTVYGADGMPVAWAGRNASRPPTEADSLSSPRLLFRAGTIATTLLATAPVRGADGRAVGFAAAELPIALRRQIRNAFLFDFDLLTEGDPAVSLRYAGDLEPETPPAGTRGLLHGPDDSVWARYEVRAPAAALHLQLWRSRYRTLAAALGLACLLVWLFRRRAEGPPFRDVLVAAALARLLLWLLPITAPGGLTSPSLYASGLAASAPAGALQLVGSPLDVLLTVALVFLSCAWLFVLSVSGRGGLPSVAAPLADLLGLVVAAAAFIGLSDLAFESRFELEQVRLLPSRPAYAALQITALLVLLSGTALAAALQCRIARPASAAGTGWRALVVLSALWTAARAWPRDTMGVPLVPAIAVLLVAVWAGMRREALLSGWRRASPGGRAGLLIGCAVGAQLVVHPSLVHYAEKNRRLQIQDEYAPLVLAQPDWRDGLLAEAQNKIDAQRLLEPRLAEDDDTNLAELAFALWSRTPLAAHGFSSAVEVQNAAGDVVSRFALNLPWVATEPLELPSADDWKVDWHTLRLVSETRPVRHARRRIAAGARQLGAVHLYVADDFWNLPFLESRDPYPTLFRSATGRQRRERPAHLLVYDEHRDLVFSSSERPPGISEELVRRAATPPGVWTTLAFGPVPHHAFLFSDGRRTFGLSFPRSSPARYAANLAEAAAGTALGACAFLLLIMAARSLRRRPTFTLGAFVAAMQGRFSLRLFAAFVGLAVVSVAVLQLVTRGYLIERLRLSTERQGLQRAEVAQKAVEDFAYFQRGESPGDEPVTDPALVWVASLVRNDVDLFRTGEIAASSKRELYASRLLGTRVSGPVYRALVLEGQPEAIRTEQIGSFSYLVASVPVRLDRGEPAIVSIPLALRQREVQSIVEDLDRTIRLVSLLFLAGAALLAHRLARRISDPLRALTAATERIARGDLEARVEVRSRDELRQLVDSFNRMAADLDTQRRELERSNRLAAFAEMARQVAHEVKNPLTPIQLSAQHLRRVYQDPHVDFAQSLEQCTTTILDQVRKLREIATEFSSFARPPAVERSTVELPAVVGEVAEPYRTALPPGVALEISIVGPVPAVRVDRRLFDRALVNILENAVHAVGETGTIAITVRGNNSRAEIQVADSGPGIDPALRERVFEPFFSTKTSGSGLGLALVKKIVEDHGGGVSLESEPGAGTRVMLWLPPADD